MEWFICNLGIYSLFFFLFFVKGKHLAKTTIIVCLFIVHTAYGQFSGKYTFHRLIIGSVEI